jgi:lipopolysaccharide transport system ATP-binding protein
MSVVIKTEGLGKQYRIAHEQGPRYATLRDTLMERLSSLGRGRTKVQQEDFWALRDVDLAIREGERVGIIGRNGAGKSTLLKLLSRITEPSAGRMQVRGRVASLLEVGTGFHPELSGRENIYLNGAVLGMSRLEIRRAFDEIVAFAEVERFLDTPVKRYSSGMYTRLAFSVAAYLRSDILLVDEVLAVGDIAFQKKCLSKLNDLGEHGHTIVFVSHNLSQVRRLCTRGVVVAGGSLDYDGDMEGALSHYVSSNTDREQHQWLASGNPAEQPGEDVVRPLAMRLVDDTDTRVASVDRAAGHTIYVEIDFDLIQPVEDLTLGYSLFDDQGNHLYRCLHTDADSDLWPVLHTGRNILRSRLPVEWLNEGCFSVVLDGGIYKKRWLFHPVEQCQVALCFDLHGRETSSEYWQSRRMGLVAPVIPWTQQVED